MTRARRDQQWREQAARLIAEAHVHEPSTHADISARYGYVRSRRLDREAGQEPRFDVALVRTYCERLISEADDLDVEREVFTDWTRARGMGPENRDRGAFVVACSECHGRPLPVVDELQQLLAVLMSVNPKLPMTPTSLWSLRTLVVQVLVEHGIHATPELSFDSETRKVVVRGLDDALRCSMCDGAGAQRGGWPGKLAREYAAEQRSRRRCPRKDCDSGVLVKPLPPLTEDDASAIMALVRQGAITASDASDIAVGACPECKRFAATRTSRAFANGGNLRRAARRLLDTLDGRCPWNTEASTQPSKCARCKGKRYHRDKTSQSRSRKCADCSGTGHNLRGVLPPLPEETRRKLAPTRPRYVSTIHDSILVDPLVDDAEPEFTEQLRRMWLDDIVPLTAARRDALAYWHAIDTTPPRWSLVPDPESEDP